MTAARLAAPQTYVIVNNSQYAILKAFAASSGISDSVPGLDLPRLDITLIAEGFGCKAETVKKGSLRRRSCAPGARRPLPRQRHGRPRRARPAGLNPAPGGLRSAASRRPYRSMAVSRSLYFWILPLAVIGFSTKST